MRKGNKLIEEGKVPDKKLKMSDFTSIRDSLKAFYLDGVEAGYEAGYEEGEKCQDEVMYDNGMKDAWEICKRIFKLQISEASELFGTAYNPDIVEKYTPMEVKEKIEAWEQQKDVTDTDVGNIKVGDEVRCKLKDDNFEGIVTAIYFAGDDTYVLEKSGKMKVVNKKNLTKTGRNLTYEVDEFLSMIGEGQE